MHSYPLKSGCVCTQTQWFNISYIFKRGFRKRQRFGTGHKHVQMKQHMLTKTTRKTHFNIKPLAKSTKEPHTLLLKFIRSLLLYFCCFLLVSSLTLQQQKHSTFYFFIFSPQSFLPENSVEKFTIWMYSLKFPVPETLVHLCLARRAEQHSHRGGLGINYHSPEAGDWLPEDHNIPDSHTVRLSSFDLQIISS